MVRLLASGNTVRALASSSCRFRDIRPMYKECFAAIAADHRPHEYWIAQGRDAHPRLVVTVGSSPPPPLVDQMKAAGIVDQSPAKALLNSDATQKADDTVSSPRSTAFGSSDSPKPSPPPPAVVPKPLALVAGRGFGGRGRGRGFAGRGFGGRGFVGRGFGGRGIARSQRPLTPSAASSASMPHKKRPRKDFDAVRVDHSNTAPVSERAPRLPCFT